MRPLFPRMALLLLLPLVLAACQERALTRNDGRDATGGLGSGAPRQSAADVYVELSSAYLREGSLGEALKNANKGVLVDPSSSNAHNMIALVHQRLGQGELAESHYRKAVALDPDNPYVLNSFGSFLCTQGLYDDADTYFRRAVGNPLYRTPWLAWHNAGVCALKRERRESAETYFRNALKSNARFAPALLQMADISLQQENYMSARAYLQRYIQITRHTPESLWTGIQTERQLGDKDQVSSYELLLRERFPDSDQVKQLGRASR